MKLRGRNDCSKPKIERKGSYECIRSDSINDPDKIPKLKIRRKSKRLSNEEPENKINKSNVEDIKTRRTRSMKNPKILKQINGKLSPITSKYKRLKIDNNIKKSSKEVDLNETITQINVSDSDPLDFIPEQVVLNDETIQSQISKSTKLSRGLNCESIYYHFKKKVSISNQLFNSSLLPDSLESYSPYSKTNFIKLKNWLHEWKTIYNPELKKPKSNETSDDSDFDPNKSDCEVNYRSSYPFCVIYGSVGSGKTSLVHSIAKEMNFKIFEINTSQRRTGKDVMDVLDNLYSNHNVTFNKNVKVPSTSDILKALDVRKRKATTLDSFFSPTSKRLKTVPSIKRQESNLSIGKDSLFLFDDVDVVLEDDLGFLNSISTLIGRSKRPIILTCSDRKEMSKFISKYNYENFLEIDLQSSVRNIAVYIQILLLSLNMQYDISHLSNWIKNLTNRSTDVRFLINNLQFQSVYQMKLFFTPINEFLDWSEMEHLMEDPEDEEDSVGTMKSISNYMSLLSTSDSYLSLYKGTACQLERMGNLDRSGHQGLHYDQSNDLRAEIEQEIIKTSSVILQDYELIGSSKETMFWNRKYSLQSMPCLANKRSLLKNCCVRTQVTSRHHYVDRMDGLLKIAINETKRKEKNTERRFRHYFQKIGLDIPATDLRYLERGYK